ncbi:MAG: hypothetical protein UU93_C0011G0002 [Candidatus Amesbacteria bacterium GW2011_GWA2_42_12]|uniref:Sodium/calcium exchanger membrane region domain-containing protein n=1 Tax=Candidatus Amesbacteria bacterium GW2011_GWA2_42_12 TaxID=1618356 RepID=A0A0G1AD49_9BACT|nr:MAG: hypothetical protein UU93_C0011G0002 [Candidatus Amesbacteria bacterium GW2011_GWA2_42_12]
MEYLILKFVFGVGLLLFATRIFIKLVGRISQRSKLSPLIIGTTVVAIGTSLPELVVSGASLIRGDLGLAWGNIVGSNIVNVLLVFPVGILMGKLRIGSTKTQRNILILFGATAVFMILQMWVKSGLVAGIILLVMAVLVTVEEYLWGVDGRKHEDAKRFKHQAVEKLRTVDIIQLIFILGLIALGGVMTVRSIDGISLVTGYSTTVLGLTLTAIATSLPELLTTIFSQEEHQDKVIIGNIMGSNLYNLLLIGGLITLFSVPQALAGREAAWLGLSTLVFGLILHRYSGKSVPRWVGLLLFAFLGGYIAMEM